MATNSAPTALSVPWHESPDAALRRQQQSLCYLPGTDPLEYRHKPVSLTSSELQCPVNQLFAVAEEGQPDRTTYQQLPRRPGTSAIGDQPWIGTEDPQQNDQSSLRCSTYTRNLEGEACDADLDRPARIAEIYLFHGHQASHSASALLGNGQAAGETVVAEDEAQTGEDTQAANSDPFQGNEEQGEQEVETESVSDHTTKDTTSRIRLMNVEVGSRHASSEDIQDEQEEESSAERALARGPRGENAPVVDEACSGRVVGAAGSRHPGVITRVSDTDDEQASTERCSEHAGSRQTMRATFGTREKQISEHNFIRSDAVRSSQLIGRCAPVPFDAFASAAREARMNELCSTRNSPACSPESASDTHASNRLASGRSEPDQETLSLVGHRKRRKLAGGLSLEVLDRVSNALPRTLIEPRDFFGELNLAMGDNSTHDTLVLTHLFFAIASPDAFCHLHEACEAATSGPPHLREGSAESVRDAMQALDRLDVNEHVTSIARRFYLAQLVEARQARQKKHLPPASKPQIIRLKYGHEKPRLFQPPTGVKKAASQALKDLMLEAYPELCQRQADIAETSTEYKKKYAVLRTRLTNGRNWHTLQQKFSRGILALVSLRNSPGITNHE
jgi:hypothetical protein